jgi:hypothetical protein
MRTRLNGPEKCCSDFRDPLTFSAGSAIPRIYEKGREEFSQMV